MASITSLSNSSYNTNSIYGNRNVLSGLASGMDTETMIENAVSGIKLKIQNLQIKRTKVEWQQEAYRSIIDKAVNLNQKYTSYTSKTNLLSSSFFNNAVNTKALGTYSDKVTASGKTSSNIKINSVKQLATAATYSVSGLGGLFKTSVDGDAIGITGSAVDLGADVKVSNYSGIMSLQYGGTNGTTFNLQFDELEDLDKMEGNTQAEKLANAINQKLSEITYNYTKNGFAESTTAGEAIKASVKDGKIVFEDGLGNGNSVNISYIDGKLKSSLGVSAGKDTTSISVNYDMPNFTSPVSTAEYLSGKELTFSLNGKAKKITLGDYDKDTTGEALIQDIQSQLDSAFGKGKITLDKSGDDKKFTLDFAVEEGSTLSVSGGSLPVLGLPEGGATNYIDTGKKLSDLLGEKSDKIFTEANRLKGTGGAMEKTSPNGTKYYVDNKGNRVDKDGYRVDDNGKALYDFQLNGAHINVTEDTTLESLLNSINSNAEAGMKVSYSKLTNEFKFTTTETGSNSKIEFGGLANALFGAPTREGITSKSKFTEAYDIHPEAGDMVKLDFGKFDYSFKVGEEQSIQDVVDHLNRGPMQSHEYNASFDELSGQLIVTDRTGKKVDFSMSMNDTEIKAPTYGPGYTPGQDAVMDVEINGKRFEKLTRNSNSIDIDGLTINVKDTFDAVGKDGKAYEPVTFETTTDVDKIVEAVRGFVEDYNALATEVKNAYSTLPAQKSNGAKYEPLTAEQEESYSESELAAYNEKAKQGILFGDTTLSSMYGKMLNAITPGGTDGQALREIGLGTSYSDGMTTISLDEDKLRAALESDPDKVRNVFSKTKEGGSASDGLMQNLQNTLNAYTKTTGEPKGALIVKAGSIKAPTSLNSNSLKSQMDSIDSQIERWQNKMSDQIDRYTTKFSRLEQLIAEMNSQSSAFAGLMGGAEGY